MQQWYGSVELTVSVREKKHSVVAKQQWSDLSPVYWNVSGTHMLFQKVMQEAQYILELTGLDASFQNGIVERASRIFGNQI